MTELRDPNTQTPPPAGGPTSSPADPDPLHNLYRMSRTAGLGSGDYVAINNTSILALLLGLASVLALLYSLMFVVVAAAIVCGIVALVQIRSSNGTQSGRIFAAAGIVLAVLFGSAAGGKMLLTRWEQRKDEQAISQVVKRLSELISAGQYSQAYQTLFSDQFKNDFSEQAFVQRWESFLQYYGGVKEIGWGERAEFQQLRGTDAKRAVAASYVEFEKLEERPRQPITFTLEEGEWMIDGIGQLFEKPKPEPGRPAMPDPTAPLGPELLEPEPGNSAAPG